MNVALRRRMSRNDNGRAVETHAVKGNSKMTEIGDSRSQERKKQEEYLKRQIQIKKEQLAEL